MESTPEARHATQSDAWRRVAMRALHPANSRHYPDALSALAKGVAALTVPVELSDVASTSMPTFQRVLLTDAHEIWVVGWPGSSRRLFESQRFAAGAICLVSGALDARIIGEHGVTTRRLGAGSLLSFAVTDRQVLRNPSHRPATSVHVYERGT